MSLAYRRRIPASAALASLLALAVLVAGCSQPTPEEKLQMAQDKVQIQRPPDYLGATILLKDVIKLPEVDPTVKISAYLQLIQIYMQIGELEKAQEYATEARDAFGLDTDEGQTAAAVLIEILGRKGDLEAALGLTREMMGLSEIPVPRRTQMRLREASILAGLGKNDEAAAKYHEMALEFDEPQLEQLTLENWVQLAAAESPLKGAEVYEAFIAAKPDSPLSPMARFGAGFFYMQAGEKEKGLALMSAFIEGEVAALAEIKEPQPRIERSLALARAYQLAGDLDAERALYRSLADEFKTDPAVGAALLMLLSRSYIAVADFEPGLAVLEEIQKTFPQTPQAEEAAAVHAKLLVARAQFEKQKAEVDAATAAEEARAAEAGDEPGADAAPEPEALPEAASTAPEAEATPESTPEAEAPAVEEVPAAPDEAPKTE